MNLPVAKFCKATLALLALLGLGLSHAQAADTKTVVTGRSVTISVTANGTQPFTYQWTKDGAAISGATGASYSISSVAATHAGTYRVTVSNSAGSVQSDASVLTVVAATVITGQPTARTITAGQSTSFSVTATGAGTLAYQWSRNGTAIAGATSATYSISNATLSHAGNYAVTVTGTGGTVTSNTVALTVNPAPAAGTPDGFAALATGGAAGSTVTVSNATDFRTYAQSTTAYVINVSGTINLGGSVSVRSNKTIQGLDANSTIVGNLDLGSGGVSNVIIRGLNITNPGTTISNGAYTDGGNGITIRNASNVFVTHCTLFDCANNHIEISNGADNVTVSWSEFYYTSAQTVHRQSIFTGLAGSETKPLRVTLHHNWWSDLCDQSLPTGTYGHVHLYNNYFNASGNTSGTNARDNAQFLVERNQYLSIRDPLYKENVDTAQAAGRIRAIANTFTSCTGRAVDTGTDAVLTPTYSYEMYPADDVDAVLAGTSGLAGNTNGAGSTTPSSSTASVTGPGSAVSPGSSFTLTAVANGFSGTSYQWRRNNADISGATASTYSVSSMQSANAGVYTVSIGLASGNFVVSTPFEVTLGSVVSPDPGGGSSSGGAAPAAAAASGGGGGAPGWAYLAALLAVGLARFTARRRTR